MKILMITLHSQNNNYGSVLQAYSLYSFLAEIGHDVTVLDYQPYYSNGITNVKMLFRKAVSNTLFLPQYVVRSKKFNSFIKKEKLSKHCTKYDQLREIADMYDVLLIGSDQVWNPHYLCGKDPAYTLQFSDSKNKMSYAASIGTEDITYEELQTLLDNIAAFKYVSLREEASTVLLKEHGRIDARYVLDPVFLHDENYYRELQSDIKESGYILAYIMNRDPLIEEIVEGASKKYKKRVIQIGGFMSKCRCDKFYRSAGPEDFLALIDGADYVITSSFHGASFSHIYHKQFLVVMPPANQLRLMNILQTAGTTNRIARKISDLEILDSPIDYQYVDERLNRMKVSSKQYLKDSLDEIRIINNGNM